MCRKLQLSDWLIGKMHSCCPMAIANNDLAFGCESLTVVCCPAKLETDSSFRRKILSSLPSQGKKAKNVQGSLLKKKLDFKRCISFL